MAVDIQTRSGIRSLALASVMLCMGSLLVGCGQEPDSPKEISELGISISSIGPAVDESVAESTASDTAPSETTPSETTSAEARPIGDGADSDERSLPDSPVATAAPNAWPVFRGTAESTGRAPAQLPDKPELLWKRAFEKGSFDSSAVIVGGVIYVGNLDGYLYALDAATGKTRWKYFSELGFTATPAVRDGRVFIGDTDGLFVCLDAAADGKPLWRHQTNAEINSSANFYGDYVLVGSQDATVSCLRRDDGELVWEYTIGDMIQCGITVTEHYCFVAGCDSVLHVVDVDTGEAYGTVPISDPTGATPSVWGDMLFVGTQGAAVLAIDWRAGEVVWIRRQSQRQLPYQSSPAVDGSEGGAAGRIVIGGRDKFVHCLDAATGEAVWEFATKGRVDSSPLLMGGRVYVGSADGRVYGIDLASGEEAWNYEAGGKFSASPSVADGRMVIGSSDGVLYCFGSSGETSAAP
jgi:outer membrane protein assembly factor BamB